MLKTSKEIISIFGRGKVQDFLTFATLLEKSNLSIDDVRNEMKSAVVNIGVPKSSNPRVICPQCKHPMVFTPMNTNRRNVLPDKEIKGEWTCDICGDSIDIR